MKKNTAGYLLFVVLIFLHIFSLLIWYDLAFVKTMMRVNRDDWNRKNIVRLSQEKMQIIETNMTGTEYCIIPVLPSSRLAAQLPVWWQKHACVLDGYYYVIEVLGVSPCAEITDAVSQKMQVKYYRITITSAKRSDKMSEQNYVLQSVVAKKTQELVACREHIYSVNQGVQMRREI